ncbi:hypothetical protein COB64_03755 [Candidatus Wolfebacteria bacterium]|nr:MAG: hypothetical protein COB64_03755 [Candidatus Wolfebacteria bacterium]
MRTYYFKLILAVCFLSPYLKECAHAQDLLAGEITSNHVSGFTYDAIITIYAKDTAINRDSIIIAWGDGVNDTVLKISDNKINDLRVITYMGTHLFPGDGVYSISYSGNYRVSGLENIPFSETTSLLLEHTLLISSTYNNSSVQFLSPPYDIGASGEVYNYWPAAYDPDGDSLSYSINAPSGSGSSIPAGISINAITGDLIWNLPSQAGDYAIRLEVTEWRNSTIISTVKREMLIHISAFTSIHMPVSNDIKIYPNPTAGLITVTGLPREPTRITVYNVLGQMVHEETLTRSGEPVIDLSDLTDGIYLIQVKEGQQTHGIRIIKQ